LISSKNYSFSTFLYDYSSHEPEACFDWYGKVSNRLLTEVGKRVKRKGVIKTPFSALAKATFGRESMSFTHNER
jgi:hypothetical protein